MNLRPPLLAAAILLTFTPALAKAQVQDPLLALPDGQVILNISATERQDVEQDLLVGTLNYVVTDTDAAKVQNEINKVMKDALDTAKKEETLKVNTGVYQVYETTEPRTKERKWRGQQSITIKSMDADSVLETTQKLQKLGLTMENLSYTLSPDTAVGTQDSLMEDALKQLQERANRAAKALGKTSAELRDVNVQGANIPMNFARSRSNMMMEAGASPMAAPVAAAGDQTISLTVSARAILKP